jgi:GDP-mannose 6-dehydrogenase
MKVAILGLGYVGMTAAACLASQGHEVLGVDPNDTKVDMVTSGKSPITEPGLDELVAEGVSKGLLKAVNAIDAELASCQLAIVCVGTPSASDGSHNMSFIAEVSRQIALVMKEHPDARLTVAYRSTVRPGTIEELIHPIFTDVLGPDVERIELVYNPEFLRESVAISDFFAPPKIVIGTRDGGRCAALDAINEGLDAPVFYVRFREAEITKFIDNSFHAVKTTFANEIGRVCTKLGISAKAVHEIFVSDTKLNISKYYLRPGGPFGGSCLPKDVRALQYISNQVAGSTYLVESLIRSNEAHKQWLFELCAQDLEFGAKVLMLGLAFKDKSDDLRESPNIDIARAFITAGYQLSIFDPHVKPANLMGQNLGALSNSPFIRNLLRTQEEIEADSFALVVDTRSIAKNYALNAARVIDINALA